MGGLLNMKGGAVKSTPVCFLGTVTMDLPQAEDAYLKVVNKTTHLAGSDGPSLWMCAPSPSGHPRLSKKPTQLATMVAEKMEWILAGKERAGALLDVATSPPFPAGCRD